MISELPESSFNSQPICLKQVLSELQYPINILRYIAQPTLLHPLKLLFDTLPSAIAPTHPITIFMNVSFSILVARIRYWA
jgi:hypothetical protein